jgi:plastocyanin
MRNQTHRKPNLGLATFVILAALPLIAAAGFPMLVRAGLPAASGSAPSKTVMVTIKNYAFDPATVTVHAGDTVEWKNDDSMDHTATDEVDPQKRAFDSGNIQQGKTWTYVAGKKGTYNYFCSIHPFMKGKLIVE